MNEDYYETIGRILNNSFSQNKDPFDVIKKRDVDLDDGQGSKFERKDNIQKEGAFKEDITKLEFQKMNIPKVAVPKYLIEDFLTLKLAPGSSLEECKASWKNLLKRYHPDLHTSNGPLDTQVIIRINNSFRRIEKWFLSYKDQ